MELKKLVAGLSIATFVFVTGTAALADTAGTSTGTSSGVVDQSQTAATTGAQTGTASGTTTGAQTGTASGTTTGTQIPAPTVMPTSIWYQLKLFIEKVEVALTFDAAKKAQLLMDQAQLRLAEAQKMTQDGKAELAAAAMGDYNQKVTEATTVVKTAVQDTKDLNKLVATIERNRPEWAQVLAQVIATVPADQQDKLAQALAPTLLAATGKEVRRDQAKEKDGERAHKSTADSGILKQVSDPVTAQAMLQAGVADRTVLALDVIARQSGKSLAEVYAQFQVEHGLGRLAKDMRVKPSEVAHAVTPEFARAKEEASHDGRDNEHGKGQGSEHGKGQGKGNDKAHNSDSERDDD